MHQLVTKLSRDFPDLKFTADKKFYWSPNTGHVFYSDKTDDNRARWSLLHETAHALLEHKKYTSDMELLDMEMQAWKKATELAKHYEITISKKHMQRCLDSYRDWLYGRSICPRCSLSGIQLDNEQKYSCYNCHNHWKVSGSRFCRTYREVIENKDPSLTLISEGS